MSVWLCSSRGVLLTNTILVSPPTGEGQSHEWRGLLHEKEFEDCSIERDDLLISFRDDCMRTSVHQFACVSGEQGGDLDMAFEGWYASI